MALFAAGFNAWNQLRFHNASKEAEPQDIFAFSKILEDDIIEKPRAGLHFTLVRGRTGLYAAGTGFANEEENSERYTATFVAGNGWTITARRHGSPAGLGDDCSGTFSDIFIGKTAVDGNDDEAEKQPTRTLSKRPVRQVVAYEVGFLILFQDGTVATLGDVRYQECLARDIRDSPADELGLVPDLLSLGDPVKHIAAGGYALGALTESGSVYVWGRDSSRWKRQSTTVFENLNGIPNYWEVGKGSDVQDFALGESHAIALTSQGCVYVIGGNCNGQLGLGHGQDHEARNWTPVELDLPENHYAVGVVAGPRASFIITRHKQDARMLSSVKETQGQDRVQMAL